MQPERICVVTGTRTEYGLLRWVMEGIRQSPVLDLQLIATGMHLSPEFGLTVRNIEAGGSHDRSDSNCPSARRRSHRVCNR
ncbi:MAG: hypothetical protein VBE63_25205 [Lamprobacter sp.]|uniref:hypothetical protein n=1 Tax=Lamprobacter sp. TaxID=3100796 RepID=UPI002B25A6EB|nr:hypothetical protein [Lamprobacter sp.]MEA3643209.1 hypothetical protein [Lamprobacter sp.]